MSDASSSSELPVFPGGGANEIVVRSVPTRLREYFSTSQTDGPLLPRSVREVAAGTAWAVVLVLVGYITGDLIAGMVVGTASGAVGAALGYYVGIAQGRHASLRRAHQTSTTR